MQFRVRHVTSYAYDKPVRLGPHWLRLRPRLCDPVDLVRFTLDVDPKPAGTAECLDVEGNLVTRLWFEDATRHLKVTSAFEARTRRHNPFDYLAQPAPLAAPYPGEMLRRLAPWVRPASKARAVRALGDRLREGASDALDYVQRVDSHLFHHIHREIRDTGDPNPPEVTLATARGACRDLTVLFVALCRHAGLAARFVSGYQHLPSLPEALRPGAPPRRHMHAWPEVYLPGGGWRGFDPTRGLAVADAHVALAAAADPKDASPFDGHYFGTASATLSTEIEIDVCE